DTSQGAPGDPLELTASAGGAAFVFGRGEKVLAEVLATHSITSDTPAFWRREGRPYPSHAGRYTGEPAYFKHLIGWVGALMGTGTVGPPGIGAVVFHMPNDKFPEGAAKALGFDKKQLEAGFLVREMGNAYSGSSPIDLAATLDCVEPGALVLLVSYGS